MIALPYAFLVLAGLVLMHSRETKRSLLDSIGRAIGTGAVKFGCFVVAMFWTIEMLSKRGPEYCVSHYRDLVEQFEGSR